MKWCCFTSNVSEPIKVSKVSNILAIKEPNVKEPNVKEPNVKEPDVKELPALENVSHVESLPVVSANVLRSRRSELCNLLLLGMIVFLVYAYVLKGDVPNMTYRDRNEL